MVLNIKAFSCFMELICASIVIFSAPNDQDICARTKYSILFWVFRLPIEMPYLKIGLSGDQVSWKFWGFDILWTLAFYSMLILFSIIDNCRDFSESMWLAHLLLIGTSPLCLFLNWPFVSVWLSHKFEEYRPILPHLPHERFSVFKKDHRHHTDENNSCVICLNDYEDHEIITLLPCGHFFHQQCIILWLKDHNSCPMCRQDIPDDGWSESEEESPNLEALIGAPQAFPPIEAQVPNQQALPLQAQRLEPIQNRAPSIPEPTFAIRDEHRNMTFEEQMNLINVTFFFGFTRRFRIFIQSGTILKIYFPSAM